MTSVTVDLADRSYDIIIGAARQRLIINLEKT